MKYLFLIMLSMLILSCQQSEVINPPTNNNNNNNNNNNQNMELLIQATVINTDSGDTLVKNWDNSNYGESVSVSYENSVQETDQDSFYYTESNLTTSRNHPFRMIFGHTLNSQLAVGNYDVVSINTYIADEYDSHVEIYVNGEKWCTKNVSSSNQITNISSLGDVNKTIPNFIRDLGVVMDREEINRNYNVTQIEGQLEQEFYKKDEPNTVKTFKVIYSIPVLTW